MSRKVANRASERGYRWRMFDASLLEIERKRPPFLRLPTTIAIAASISIRRSALWSASWWFSIARTAAIMMRVFRLRGRQAIIS